MIDSNVLERKYGGEADEPFDSKKYLSAIFNDGA